MAEKRCNLAVESGAFRFDYVNLDLQLKMSIRRDTLLGVAPLSLPAALRIGVAFRLPGLNTRKEGRHMSDDPNKVWPTGLTLKEAEEVHSYLIDGTRVFGAIALLAHVLVAVSTPWLG